MKVGSSFPRIISSPELHKEETLLKVIMGKEQQSLGQEGSSGGSSHLGHRGAVGGGTPLLGEMGKKSQPKPPCLASPLSLKVHYEPSTVKPMAGFSALSLRACPVSAFDLCLPQFEVIPGPMAFSPGCSPRDDIHSHSWEQPPGGGRLKIPMQWETSRKCLAISPFPKTVREPLSFCRKDYVHVEFSES